MPWSVASSSRTESSATAARDGVVAPLSDVPASSTPIPAITAKPCGSIQILPSVSASVPTGWPKKSYARRNQRPSQPCSSTATRMASTSARAAAATSGSPRRSAICAYCSP